MMSDAVITVLLLLLRLQESSISESITQNRLKHIIKMKIHNGLHKINTATFKTDFLHVNQAICTRLSIENLKLETIMSMFRLVLTSR